MRRFLVQTAGLGMLMPDIDVVVICKNGGHVN